MILVSILPLVTLIGWIFDLRSLISYLHFGSMMNPLTAICFIIVLVCFYFKLINKTKYVISLGLTLVLISIIRLLSVSNLISFEIDLLFFSEMISSFSDPARMSIFTATSFFVLGFIFIVINFEKIRDLYIDEILSFTLFVFSSFVILNKIIGFFYEPEVTIFFSASLNTAVLFLFSSIFLVLNVNKKDGRQFYISKFYINLILLVSIIFTVSSSVYVDNTISNTNRNNFELHVDNITYSIKDRIAVYKNVLLGGTGFISATQGSDREGWRVYIENLNIQDNYPGVQGMGYSIFIDPEQKKEDEEKVQSKGFSDYKINPEGERDIYTSILYLEPFDLINQQTFGYDMYSNSVRKDAIDRAIETGEVTISAPVTLVQETDKDAQHGFIVYAPVYIGNSTSSSESRFKDVGIIHAAFKAENFIDNSLDSIDTSDITLKISDLDESSYEGNIIYSNSVNGNDKIINDSFHYFSLREIEFGGRIWTLEFESTDSFAKIDPSKYMPLLIFTIGIIFSFLIAFVLYAFSSARKKAIDYAKIVNKDLIRKNNRIKLARKAGDFGIWDFDVKKNKLIWDDKMYEIYNLNKDTFKCEYSEWEKLIYKEDLQRISNLFRKALTGKSDFNTHFRFLSKDGFVKYIKTSAFVVKNKKREATRVTGINLDVTHEMEVDKTKTEFVSLASHQLRTPLAAISWYTEMLISGDAGKLNKKQNKYLDEIYTGSQRMISLVRSLLDVSRLELGTYNINPEDIDIVKLLKVQVKENSQLAKNKKIKIKLDIDKNVKKAFVDEDLLNIVFQNLITNSLKYSPEKTEINIELKRLKKGSTFNDKKMQYDALLYKVKDSGYGIPESQKDKIFKKLFRADNIKEYDSDGTGLGLYIIKTIVDNIKGYIWFESEINKGTTFYVIIPEKMKKSKSLKEDSKI